MRRLVPSKVFDIENLRPAYLPDLVNAAIMENRDNEGIPQGDRDLFRNLTAFHSEKIVITSTYRAGMQGHVVHFTGPEDDDAQLAVYIVEPFTTQFAILQAITTSRLQQRLSDVLDANPDLDEEWCDRMDVSRPEPN